MALKGSVRASCPNGCEETGFEVWCFIRGDADSTLRESLLAGELNLQICGGCGRMFFPEASVVYFDPTREILLFVFPESYQDDVDRWRRKMREDCAQMRELLGGTVSGQLEPELCFGMRNAGELLKAEERLDDEAKVAELLCRELGLAVYPVQRAYARARRLPGLIPCRAAKNGRRFSRSGAIYGIKALLAANNRLSSYRRWLEVFGKDKAFPPCR